MDLSAEANGWNMYMRLKVYSFCDLVLKLFIVNNHTCSNLFNRNLRLKRKPIGLQFYGNKEIYFIYNLSVFDKHFVNKIIIFYEVYLRFIIFNICYMLNNFK